MWLRITCYYSNSCDFLISLLLLLRIGIRQERPLHMRPEAMHPAMRERGVPIAPTRTVVEGRPGPIPGMRPPMGGGAFQQSQPKGSSSMGLIMPLYTVGIVAFFAYTILKVDNLRLAFQSESLIKIPLQIVFKKNTPAQEPYVEILSRTPPAKKAEESIIQKSSLTKDQAKQTENGTSPKLGKTGTLN